MWQRWRLRTKSSLQLCSGSRSHLVCSRGRSASLCLYEVGAAEDGLATMMTQGRWSVTALARRLSPAKLVDRFGAAWSSTRAVDCLASVDAGFGACLQHELCRLCHRWWSWSRHRGGVMMMTQVCNLDGFSPRCRLCVLAWVARSPRVPCFCDRVVTVFTWLFVN